MEYLMLSIYSLMAAALLQAIYTRYSAGLNRVPGPLLASISNIWKVIAVYRQDAHTRHIALHERYGPVVRIGPKHISFASPTALHAIHASRDAFAKSDFYSGTTAPIYEGKPVYNLFSLRDVEHHNHLKRNLASLYAKAAVQDFEENVDTCSMLMVDQIRSRITSGRAPTRLNMSLWAHFYAFDSLCSINISKTFGFLEKGTDIGGMLAFGDDVMHLFGLCAQAPVLGKVNSFLKWLKGVNTGNNPLFRYTVANIHERIEKPNGARDMLNSFLKAREEKPESLSKRDIVGAIYINLMAGHDVLATSLRAIFYYLAKNPEAQQRLRGELISAAEPYPLSKPVRSTDLLKLRYLEAVIYEAFRVHPTTGLILERTVPPGGAYIDGYPMPENTIVGCNAWVLHNNQTVFGNSLDKFKPERWSEASDAQLAEMKRHIFTFGAGPRMCIGHNIAWLQITKVVCEFFRRFECTLAEPQQEWKVRGSWVTKQTEMDMDIRYIEGFC